MRTVSIVSEFHEDQLRNLHDWRNSLANTHSTISILYSIYPIQKLNTLDISF